MKKNNDSKESVKTYAYKAPTIYVAFFYALLLAWTVITVLYIGTKGWVSWLQFFMAAFVFIMTWYFSMGISYRVEINDDGKLTVMSFRRIVRAYSTKVEMVEGPHLPIGFIRFRLEREKVYLFGVPTNRDLQQVLVIIHKTNPDVMFKNITLAP